MQKLLLISGLFLFLCINSYGQVKPDSLKSPLDSMAILNDLINLLDSSDKPSSYMNIEMGIGNRLFSVRNNALNSKQTSENRLIYSPAVGYFHKSGVSISVGASLLNDGINSFGVSQYSISPAYELKDNNNIGFGISYSHYFVKDKYSAYSSPIQNDFYSSFTYKKPWLQPGIAVGFSSGNSYEVITKDTLTGLLRRKLYDSITFKSKVFSLIASAGHQFEWYELLNKKDGLLLNTTFMLNMGSNRTDISHNAGSKAYLFNRLNRKGKIPKVTTNKFEAESAGLSITLDYSIGRFVFEPLLYLDYYLPETTAQQFTSLFSLNVSFAL